MILKTNPDLSGRPDLSGPSGALFGPKDEAELPLGWALDGQDGGRAIPARFHARETDTTSRDVCLNRISMIEMTNRGPSLSQQVFAADASSQTVP